MLIISVKIFNGCNLTKLVSPYYVTFSYLTKGTSKTPFKNFTIKENIEILLNSKIERNISWLT